MQTTMGSFACDTKLTQEEKCLLGLLIGRIDPLEIENSLPMFYSVDTDCFHFVVSGGRTALGSIYTEVNWAERIAETLLAVELKRQDEFYAGNEWPAQFFRSL